MYKRQSYDNQIISPTQAIDYALPSSGVISIQDLLMRPSSDNKFLLTMKRNYFTTTNYNKLAAGTFDKGVMNKFATQLPINGQNEDMFTFIGHTPYGFEATTTSNATAGKFWGTTKTGCKAYVHTDGSGCISEYCTVTHYDFWIITKVEIKETPNTTVCNP